MNKTKIKSLAKIVLITRKFKKMGKIVVTTNGIYDLIHPGHIKSLAEAKKQGDILIVGVNSNKSTKLNKGSNRPIMDEAARTEVVAALESVDFVFVFDEPTPLTFLEKIKPQIHANSSDYGKDCIEKDTVEKNGGKIYLLKKYPGFSSTNIIKQILKKHGLSK